MLWRQSYARGKPTTKLINAGTVHNRRGTSIRFKPDPNVFCAVAFRPARLFRLCRSKAYLFRGVQIRWACEPSLLRGANDDTPAEAVLHFPGGLRDSLQAEIGERAMVLAQPWVGEADLAANAGRVEWAAAWLEDGEGFVHSYCNTIATEQGGTHEAGFRAAILKGLRAWGEHRGNRRAAQVVAEDLLGPIATKLSVFLRDPQFQ